MNRYDVPGVSMALVKNGKLVWSDAYGHADVEPKRKMTVDMIYRAESLSKPVTAWGVMRLVEQGQVDLDDPIRRHLDEWTLPESAKTAQKMTIRQLLSNSAGMPLGTVGEEYSPQSKIPSLRAYLSREAHLLQEPGSGFVYSNVGFNVLELLVEEVTERGFSEYMANEVLGPLGMQYSSFRWQERLAPSIPTGYDLQGAPVPLYVYPGKGFGELFASVEDVARFVCAGMTSSQYKNNGVLGPESLHRPTRRTSRSRASAWSLIRINSDTSSKTSPRDEKQCGTEGRGTAG